MRPDDVDLLRIYVGAAERRGHHHSFGVCTRRALGLWHRVLAYDRVTAT
jgi:hypothetical protein